MTKTETLGKPSNVNKEGVFTHLGKQLKCPSKKGSYNLVLSSRLDDPRSTFTPVEAELYSVA